MEFDEHAVYQLPGASSVHYSSSVSKISARPWPRGSTCFSLPTRPVTRIESGLDQGCVWCNITSSLLCDGFPLLYYMSLPIYLLPGSESSSNIFCN